MANCNIIMITSCKGGVGKTTVAANLGMAMALLGKRTLLLDCDFGMRCLDLVMGLEDKCMYDISDVILHHVSYDKAIIRDERNENLYFLAAPYKYEGNIGEEDFKKFINGISDALDLEYIIIDTHGGCGDEIKLGAAVADLAIIVATHQSASLRAAEQTNNYLNILGVRKTRLIINCFEKQNVIKSRLPGIINIIDSTCVKLIGVIPNDPAFIIAQRKGLLIDDFKKGNTVMAFRNISLRIMGETVPLMEGFKKRKRKIIMM
ncbi:MAG: P-loop NTPase [Clostridia bacterium]|nr:P-loop NTPase [Clostridia bacterium]